MRSELLCAAEPGKAMGRPAREGRPEGGRCAAPLVCAPRPQGGSALWVLLISPVLSQVSESEPLSPADSSVQVWVSSFCSVFSSPGPRSPAASALQAGALAVVLGYSSFPCR